MIWYGYLGHTCPRAVNKIMHTHEVFVELQKFASYVVCEIVYEVCGCQWPPSKRSV